MSALIAPSLLAADFANLQRDVEMLNASAAHWLHIDIMDGRFVPNLSFGLPVLQAIQRHARKPLDVHLMIVEPDLWLGQFRDAGAHILTVHYEASTHLHRTVHAIRELGMLPGVAINPHTPVELLRDILPDIDLVCLMSVNPGFGGQRFIESTYGRIQRLRLLIEETGSQARIEVDGGVDAGNAGKLVQAGADVLVAGNAVFKAENPPAMIEKLAAAGSRVV